LVRGLVRDICYAGGEIREEANMKKLNHFWIQYGTARNLKVMYILLTLIALAVASGAPGTGGGMPGGNGL
jgi:hypothetical protein